MENKSLHEFLQDFERELEEKYGGQFVLIGSTPTDYFVHVNGTKGELQKAIADAKLDNPHIKQLL